jgi:hypothetical protein
MPARHRERYCGSPRKLSTISPEFCPRCAGINVHVGLEILSTISRNTHEIRHKNGNTRVDTLRSTYGDTFAEGVRGDMHLNTLLDKSGAKSLRDFLKSKGR